MANKRRNKRNWIIGGVILAVLIVVGVAAVMMVLNNSNQKNDNMEEYTADVEEAIEVEEKKAEETDEEYSERMAEEKKVKQYEGEDPNEAEELTGAVTYAAVNDGVLIIATNIDQFLGSGSCELSLMRGGDVIYAASADIMAGVSTSTCDGFRVPVSGLSSGAIDIIIKLSAGGKTGTIRGEVNI